MARFANRLLPHRFLMRPALGVLLAFPLQMSDIVRATYLPIMPRLPIKPNQPIMPNQPIKPIRYARHSSRPMPRSVPNVLTHA